MDFLNTQTVCFLHLSPLGSNSNAVPLNHISFPAPHPFTALKVINKDQKTNTAERKAHIA